MIHRTKKSNSLEARRQQWLTQLLADPKLGFSHLKVAMVIGWHFNRNQGGKAWPGINRIAEIAHVDRRTVMRAVQWLEEHGWLKVTRRPKGKRNLPNEYLPVLKGEAVVTPCHQVGAEL